MLSSRVVRSTSSYTLRKRQLTCFPPAFFSESTRRHRNPRVAQAKAKTETGKKSGWGTRLAIGQIPPRWPTPRLMMSRYAAMAWHCELRLGGIKLGSLQLQITRSPDWSWNIKRSWWQWGFQGKTEMLILPSSPQKRRQKRVEIMYINWPTIYEGCDNPWALFWMVLKHQLF
jgi:hypothetical protein